MSTIKTRAEAVDTRSHPSAHVRRESVPQHITYTGATLTESYCCKYAIKYAPTFDEELTVSENSRELIGVWLETEHADLDDSVALVISGGDPQISDFQKSMKVRWCLANAFSGSIGGFDARRNLLDTIASVRSIHTSLQDEDLLAAAKAAASRSKGGAAAPSKRLIDDLSKFDD